MHIVIADEKGQSSAEYILLIAGVLGIVLIVLYASISYMNEVKTGTFNATNNTTIWSSLKDKFKNW
ncbi:conserved hypothetical protein [Methanothermus fervidus DSM 2088]|uniref:Class III signal peptide-containing protein n=1 Tax=Methanothermus fervidus (strain ATCC 43054 / DSM 2088 / JCM 10308 / V24 S) TaxID=523846 RepID=E3GYV9_METFV|nr:class III signal peptide-containing protein [Methanothermus fervidus]ADP77491.1 conserved hypothetical protein [Methanothermus fervidus DSM 2088]